MAEPQPPEGLRKIIRAAIERACPTEDQCLADEAECFKAHPIHEFASREGRLEAVYADVDGMVGIVLAAVFEACEVREDFPLTCTTPYSKLPREVVHKTREGAVSDARGYARDGFTPVKVEHLWTLRYRHPVMRIVDDEVADPKMSNREFLSAEVDRLGLQPKVDAMWAEIENAPPPPPGWCSWHQMADCFGDAPECREARAERTTIPSDDDRTPGALVALGQDPTADTIPTEEPR